MSGKWHGRSYVEGPRWANLKGLLWGVALECGVSIEFEEEDSGWVRKTVWFDASSDDRTNLDRFIQRLGAVVL